MKSSKGLALLALVVSGGFANWVRTGALDGDPSHRSEGIRLIDAISPGRRALALISAEHRLAAADLFWLGVVQDLGHARTITATAWSRVAHGSDVATDLDHRYFTVYHSAGVNLAEYARDVDAADRILLKGRANLPDRWELPMLLGYIAYFMRGDAALAADYTQEAARSPEAPPFLAPLAGRMLFQAGDQQGAIALLEMMASTLDGVALEAVESRLLALRSEPRLLAYDRACERYRAHTQHLPPDAATLRREGWIDAEPVDASGAEITIDEGCVARSVLVPVREHEARRRIGSFRAGTSSAAARLPAPSEIP